MTQLYFHLYQFLNQRAQTLDEAGLRHRLVSGTRAQAQLACQHRVHFPVEREADAQGVHPFGDGVVLTVHADVQPSLGAILDRDLGMLTKTRSVLTR